MAHHGMLKPTSTGELVITCLIAYVCINYLKPCFTIANKASQVYHESHKTTL